MEFTSQLGKNIKALRNNMSISQGELAKGICTQALISKIEKGETSPSAELLYKVARRLKVKINYLYDLSNTTRFDYAKEVIDEVRSKIRNKEYKQVAQMVKIEKKNPLYKENIYNKQFLMWHEGICTFYLEHDEKKTINLLNEALKLTTSNNDQFSEREVEILLSIGIIYSEIKLREESITIYQKCLYHLKNLPQIQDYKIKIRVLYNLSKTLIDLEVYQKAINYCGQGINLCLEKESMYLLAEFYYQIGRSYKGLNDIDNVINYMEKAKFIFNLTNKTKYSVVIDKFISNMK